MPTVRPTQPDDAAELAALRSRVYPYLLRSEAGVRRLLLERSPTERRAEWVAVVDGRIVGTASARLNIETVEIGAAATGMHVHPDHRCRGIGAALRARIDEHLEQIGARRVRAWVQADSVAYAERHGYAASREDFYSGVDPRRLPPVPAVPAGVTVVPIADLRPEEIYAVEVDALRDEPSDMAFDSIPFEDWRRVSWDDPDLDLGVSVAARVDGRITAFTRMTIVGDRAWTDLTAVSRADRGRGLAKLLKAVALSRAAERGVVLSTTANDAANAPMLAVNDWLGYRPVATQWSCLAHRGG